MEKRAREGDGNDGGAAPAKRAAQGDGSDGGAAAPARRAAQGDGDDGGAAAAAKRAAPESRPLSASTLVTSEIVGMDELRGKLLGAGTVLDLLDLNAGRVAATYARGRVVTLSLDRVSLTVPLRHGDLVRFSGTIVTVGRSSMLVEVIVERHDTYSGEFERTHSCYVTMVAVDENGRPRRGLPPLRCDTERERAVARRVAAREEAVGRWREIEAEVKARSGDARAEDVEDVAANRGGGGPGRPQRTVFRTIASTEVITRQQYLPRSRNHSGQVFGGEILLGMDRVAVYCARNFCQSECLTVALDRVVFRVPIATSDLVEMRARVVYVRTYVLTVEVRVSSLAFGADEPVSSHVGYFTAINFGDHTKRRVPAGLDLAAADADALRSYALARKLHELAARSDEAVARADADTAAAAAAAAAE